MNRVTFWVDSLNVGFWIRGQSREYKPFVAHRVGEIHDHSSPDQWRYVPTDHNPADIGTRGLTVPELAENTKWWKGPEFLLQPEAEWPDRKFDKPSEAMKELKSTQRKREEQSTSYNNVQKQPDGDEADQGIAAVGEWRLDPSRYSKWYRVKSKGELEIGLSLVRVRGWVQRFITNSRRPEDERDARELTPTELHNAEEEIIKETQRRALAEEMSALEPNKPLLRRSSLLPFTPILMDGIPLSNTRLRNSEELPAEVKFPIILHKKSHFTRLIVKFHYEREGHRMGVNYTINHLREKYLVIHVRQEVKRAIKGCTECIRRFQSRPASQQMAPLPHIRLQMTSKPFVNCAVDFGGPYLTALLCCRLVSLASSLG